MDLSLHLVAANIDPIMNYTRVCGVRAHGRVARSRHFTCARNREYFSWLGDMDSIDTSKSRQPLSLRVLAPLSRYRL